MPGGNHRSLRVKLEDRKRIYVKFRDRLGFEPTPSATEIYWHSALQLGHTGEEQNAENGDYVHHSQADV